VVIAQLTWPEVFQALHDTCPNVLAVMNLILTLPSHSADCERGFSCMKKLKTDWRSSLQECPLNDLLRVMLLCPPLSSFNPLPAINLWNSSGKASRRPNMLPYGPRDNITASSSDNIAVSSSDSDSDDSD
jgi:hypothetical protein